MKIKILLADDHQLVRKGFRALLEELDFVEVVGEAANGKEAIALLRNGAKPDVALLDYEMPLMNGLEASEQIRRDFFGVKVIMLTIADSEEEISEAISAGVDGYVIKSSEPDHVLSAIRSVCAGQGSFPLNVMQRMAKGELGQYALDALTPREQEIVEFVKQGQSNKMIAYNLKLSENTVRNHLRNIMEKLGLKNRVQVATLALKEDRRRR